MKCTLKDHETVIILAEKIEVLKQTKITIFLNMIISIIKPNPSNIKTNCVCVCHFPTECSSVVVPSEVSQCDLESVMNIHS